VSFLGDYNNAMSASTLSLS